MPIYEFTCECGKMQTLILPVNERDKTQLCTCGKKMRRAVSMPLPAIFRKTGRDMAQATLNSRSGGMPDSNPFKQSAIAGAAAGLETKKRVIGRGFKGAGRTSPQK